MATSYPGGLDAFTNPAATDPLNSATVPHSTQHANANDAIEAIEAELGTDPAGASATVRARFEAIEAAGWVTSTRILDGTILDADINASAAIDPAKISGTAVVTGDSRLTDARTPTAHAASHASAGSDPITVAESQVTGLTSALAGKAASADVSLLQLIQNAANVVAYEDFSGAAANLDTGVAATFGGNYYNISSASTGYIRRDGSGKGIRETVADGRAVLDLGVNDLQVELRAFHGGDRAGIVFRALAVGVTPDHLDVRFGASSFTIGKVVSGTRTVLATSGTTPTNGTTYRTSWARIAGSVITAHLDGVTLSHTLTGGDETTFATSSLHGFIARSNDAVRLDHWIAWRIDQ